MIGSFINNNNGIKSMIILNNNKIVTSNYNKDSLINCWKIELYDNDNSNNNSE